MGCNMENNIENNIENQVEKKHHRGRRKKRTMRQVLSNLMLVIAVGVFLFSGFKLYGIFSEYHKGESEYDSLKDIAIQTSVPEVSEEVPEEFKVDFKKLKGINSDVVGWIRFDEPSQISYPVVKGPDNDKYLKTTFEGKRNAAGSLFMDVDNEADFSDKNTFIYGHNMKNGSMFAGLREYKAKAYWEKNPYFYIYTPDGKETVYQIFSVSIVKDTSESYQKWYNSDGEYQEYLAHIKSASRYQTGVEVSVDSQIVSLSTCTNVSDDERLLVHGVKVNEKMAEEEASDSEVDVVEE